MKLLSAKDYPKFINVNDERYEIRMVSKIPGEAAGDCGLCDDGKRIIWIRKTQSPAGLFRTFIHEILHAVEAEYNVPLKHQQVYALETALSALIMENF